MSVTQSDFERTTADALPKAEEVEATMRAQLTGVRRRLEALRTQVARFHSRDIARRRRRIQSLEVRHDAVRGDMLALRDSEGVAWETLKVRIERALDELQKGIDAVQKEADKSRDAL